MVYFYFLQIDRGTDPMEVNPNTQSSATTSSTTPLASQTSEAMSQTQPSTSQSQRTRILRIFSLRPQLETLIRRTQTNPPTSTDSSTSTAENVTSAPSNVSEPAPAPSSQADTGTLTESPWISARRLLSLSVTKNNPQPSTSGTQTNERALPFKMRIKCSKRKCGKPSKSSVRTSSFKNYKGSLWQLHRERESWLAEQAVANTIETQMEEHRNATTTSKEQQTSEAGTNSTVKQAQGFVSK